MNIEELDFLDNAEEAYKAGYGYDVDVHVGDRKFKASKLMLCAISSVFRAMFSGETKENQTNSVTINEFDVDVVEQFLYYLHTGKFPDSFADPTKFFQIADYYDIKELRETCLQFMFMTLGQNNAQEYFQMAEQFNLGDLKAKALKPMTNDIDGENFYNYFKFARSNESEELEANVVKFIEDNVWELCTLPDWKQLDPELRLKLLESRVENLDSALRPILRGKVMLEVDCGGVAALGGNYRLKTIVLTNTGGLRLVYRISPASADPNFVVSPQSGFIEPGQVHYVRIQYTSQMIIVYQATTETSISRCFQDDSFCRIILNVG